ncbi:hypothetical protein ACFL5O_09775 [Myxococcota bacterium]
MQRARNQSLTGLTLTTPIVMEPQFQRARKIGPSGTDDDSYNAALFEDCTTAEH